MSQSPYLYKHPLITRYTFLSFGRKRIEKVVDFTDLGMNNIFNLAFGDLREDGTVDVQANSNNGDIVKVLATVISILKDFTENYPKAYVAFVGSTNERTKMYTRILKSYYSIFSKEFEIFAFIRDGENYEKVCFDPQDNLNYEVFLVKRIS